MKESVKAYQFFSSEVIDICHFASFKHIPLAVQFLDAEKAFDQAECGFLNQVLQVFGFFIPSFYLFIYQLCILAIATLRQVTIKIQSNPLN